MMRLTEYELFRALRPRYPAQQFALLPQVANGTGTGATRHADALALGLWPSRGIHLHGFELKSYRNDWLREIANPAKAEDIGAYCNYWWIVTGENIVSPGELPKPWGLLEFNAKRQELITKVRAPFRKALKPPNLEFIAAMLRKAQDVMTPDSAIAEACKGAKELGYQEGLQRNVFAVDELQRLKKQVAEFEKASGVKIEGWQGGARIGDAVKVVLAGADFHLKENLLNAANAVIEVLGRPDEKAV